MAISSTVVIRLPHRLTSYIFNVNLHFPHRTAQQEIPTGLSALGMTYYRIINCHCEETRRGDVVTEGNACGAISSTVVIRLPHRLTSYIFNVNLHFPHHTALQEIPTGLSALGMTYYIDTWSYKSNIRGFDSMIKAILRSRFQLLSCFSLSRAAFTSVVSSK